MPTKMYKLRQRNKKHKSNRFIWMLNDDFIHWHTFAYEYNSISVQIEQFKKKKHKHSIRVWLFFAAVLYSQICLYSTRFTKWNSWVDAVVIAIAQILMLKPQTKRNETLYAEKQKGREKKENIFTYHSK